MVALLAAEPCQICVKHETSVHEFAGSSSRSESALERFKAHTAEVMEAVRRCRRSHRRTGQPDCPGSGGVQRPQHGRSEPRRPRSRAGDVVEIEIEGIGTLTNTVTTSTVTRAPCIGGRSTLPPPTAAPELTIAFWYSTRSWQETWRTRAPVGLGNPVAAGHAAFLYSLMRPSQRVVRSAVTVVGGEGGGTEAGVGGRWSGDRWGRCWL